MPPILGQHKLVHEILRFQRPRSKCSTGGGSMGSSVTKRGGSNAAALVLVIGRVVLSSHRSHDWQILITSSGSEMHEAKSCMLRRWMSFVAAVPIRYGPLAQYSSTNLAPMSLSYSDHEQSGNHLRPFFILITSIHQFTFSRSLATQDGNLWKLRLLFAVHKHHPK
jgi:hypothetical protein